MSKLLISKPIIEDNLPKLKKKCLQLSSAGLTPNLGVILVGNNSASEAYIRNKRKMCEKIGAAFSLHRLDANISEEDFLKQIKSLNEDPKITGCFVQLPVPKQLAHIDVTQLINPKKDVDGFHLNTISDIYRAKQSALVPCTPKGILTLLKYYNIPLEGANITIIGRSDIVGKPLSLLLQSQNATVTLCHSKTKDLSKHTSKADIIISAVGRPEYLDESYLGENQILIDVGINTKEEKLVGDIKIKAVMNNAKAITPVPGGIGPMTVYSLMENLLLTTENILRESK